MKVKCVLRRYTHLFIMCRLNRQTINLQNPHVKVCIHSGCGVDAIFHTAIERYNFAWDCIMHSTSNAGLLQ